MSERRSSIRPILAMTLRPTDERDWESFQQALHRIAAMDPTIRIKTGPGDGETTVSGMDELQLELHCQHIVHESGIRIDVSELKVVYLETIRKQAEGEAKYVRPHNYGLVKLRLEPRAIDDGLVFVNDIADASIPERYIEAIQIGIANAMQRGILAGHELVGMQVSLLGGSVHDVDSNEMSFQIAAATAFRDAARKAAPVLLEPVMNVTVTVAEEFLGTAIGNLNDRRGRIEGIERSTGLVTIQAAVPLSEMLRSSKHARPNYPMRFAGYAEASFKGDAGESETGVTANMPRRPKSGSGSAAAQINAEFE